MNSLPFMTALHNRFIMKHMPFGPHIQRHKTAGLRQPARLANASRPAILTANKN